MEMCLLVRLIKIQIFSNKILNSTPVVSSVPVRTIVIPLLGLLLRTYWQLLEGLLVNFD